MAVVLHKDPATGFQALVDEINKIQADLAALRTAYEAHVHSGITTGAGNSGARTAGGAAPALTSAAMLRGDNRS